MEPLDSANDPGCDPRSGCCPVDAELGRREFLAVGAGGALSSLLFQPARIAGPYVPRDTNDHFVPADKKLSAAWRAALFAKGEPEWIEGDALDHVGMPIGGICAGQVYLSGDGRLTYWDVFNANHNTGYGAINYQKDRKPTDVVTGRSLREARTIDQGTTVVVSVGGRTQVHPLDRANFSVRLRGEYPIGRVRYQRDDLPIAIELEAYSPFVPTNTKDSSLPATVLEYTVRNTGTERARVTLASHLGNAVCLDADDARREAIVRRQRTVTRGDHTIVLGDAREHVNETLQEDRPPLVFEDFERTSYEPWTATGEALGKTPARGTLEGQQTVTGFEGKGLVNTFLGGDDPRGKLVSKTFRIERDYVSFLIGGGSQRGKTCMNLIIDDRVVRTATGANDEKLAVHNWNVEEHRGRDAHLEIIDDAEGAWGHVNVDQIEFRDHPRLSDGVPLVFRPDFGTLALGMQDLLWHVGRRETFASVSAGDVPWIDGERVKRAASTEATGGAPLRGAQVRTFDLEPGQTHTVTFVVAWHFPNLYRGDRRVGNRYAQRFADAADVVRYVLENQERLRTETRLWRDTYYDSTLPVWLLDRVHSTVANLATTTCQWWRDGRFWAWEGGGCCHGTCGHVWNYAQAVARLYPELERSVRERQDFALGVGMNPETGAIGFRGENYNYFWAGDAQAGYVLKAYREHLLSTSDEFLKNVWPQVRYAMTFLIEQDQNADGLIEGRQHQTYDQNYFGANPFVGALYLAALRAAAAMARRMHDEPFAQRCEAIFRSGRDRSMELLFDGEYFIQDVDLEQHRDWQVGKGCLADQLFGQTWAHQLDLGHVYAPDAVRKALQAIWRYNWAPDVSLQNEHHAPERWFAYPGEAGLFTCTWPKSQHLGPRSTRYRNEVWTGIEYQVATNMIADGLVEEGLAICRAIHERYHASKRNPWNEIECGDHYARAMASWGVLIALSGFVYDGPAGHIGCAPRITPEDFRCAFTAAEGWGTLSQRRADGVQRTTFAVRYGNVRVHSLSVEDGKVAGTSSVRVTVGDEVRPCEVERQGSRWVVRLGTPVTLTEHQAITVQVPI